MRWLPFRSECANAVIMMDAFGFFDAEEEHEAVLREAGRVLTTGGRLVFKVVNGGPSTLIIDPPRMTQRISVSGPHGQGEYDRRQRLYRVEELCAALEHVGFAIVGVFARPDGATFEPTSSTAMWIVGQRRGAV
jgi:hypothetical protein